MHEMNVTPAVAKGLAWPSRTESQNLEGTTTIDIIKPHLNLVNETYQRRLIRRDRVGTTSPQRQRVIGSGPNYPSRPMEEFERHKAYPLCRTV